MSGISITVYFRFKYYWLVINISSISITVIEVKNGYFFVI